MKTRVNFVLVVVTILSLAFGIYGFWFGPQQAPSHGQSAAQPAGSVAPDFDRPDMPERAAATSDESTSRPTPAPDAPEPRSRLTPGPERDNGQTGRITGLVLDRQSQPVEGVRISAVDTGLLDVLQRTESATRTDAELQQSVQQLGRALLKGRAVAVTDKSGRFEVSGLDEDSFFDLEGFSPAHGRVKQRSLPCGTDVTLRFKADVVLAVRLQDESGVPITRAFANVQHDRWSSAIPQSSPDGMYYVEIETSSSGEGARFVTFKAKGYLLSRRFTPDDFGKPDLFAVLRKGARVHGAVTDRAGEPIRGATVMVRAGSLDNGEKFETAALINENYQTDADGCFEFSSLPPGTYEFEVRLADDSVIEGETVSVRVSDEHEVNFSLDTGARATVVVSAQNGELVPLFEVNFWRETSGMPIDVFQLTGQGRDRQCFIGLPRSTVKFSVYADGFCEYSSDIDLTSGDATVHVTLSRGAMVKGRVVSNGGTLVRGARTRWTPVSEGAVLDRWEEAPDGTFSLGPLEPGIWRVDVFSAVRPTEKLCTQSVLLSAGEAPVEVVIDSVHLISIAVGFETGAGAWANIEISPAGEETWNSIRYRREGASQTRLVAVPAGSYQVYAYTDRLYSPLVNAKPGDSVSLTLKDPDCVRITRVVEGSSADRAGIRVGDLIIEYDLQPVRSVADLVALTKAADGRADVSVVVIRNGESLSLTAQGGMFGVGVDWAAR